jgi:hypothetical protein
MWKAPETYCCKCCTTRWSQEDTKKCQLQDALGRLTEVMRAHDEFTTKLEMAASQVSAGPGKDYSRVHLCGLQAAAVEVAIEDAVHRLERAERVRDLNDASLTACTDADRQVIFPFHS